MDVLSLAKMSKVKYFDDSKQCEDFVQAQDSSPATNGNAAEASSPEAFREPLWFCKVVTERPCLTFGAVLGTHVLFVLVSAALMVGGYDLFPVEFGRMPLDLTHHASYKRDLAYNHRWQYKGRVGHAPRRHAPRPRERSEMSSKSLVLLYNAGAGNVFTRDKLQLIQRIEDSLVAVPGYQDFCQLSASGACVPPVSVLRFFDGTFASADPVFHDPGFDNIPQVLFAAHTSNATRLDFLHALGKSHTMSSERVYASLTRSVLPFGLSSAHEEELSVDFMAEHLEPLLSSYLETKEFEFVYYNDLLMIRAFKIQAFKDMKLAIGSMLFIFCFILFHTRSLWTTCLGVFSIVCSFVETNLIYRVLIGFRYFGLFHVLSVFIILGIGADDLFVFWDAWKDSKHHCFPSLAHRLDETFRKSALSMFVTSLTTALAFAASALSPFLGIMSFGVFSAILIVIDYISVVTFFPTIVVMNHLFIEKKESLLWPRCSPCCNDGCNGGGNTKLGHGYTRVTPCDEATAYPTSGEVNRGTPCDEATAYPASGGLEPDSTTKDTALLVLESPSTHPQPQATSSRDDDTDANTNLWNIRLYGTIARSDSAAQQDPKATGGSAIKDEENAARFNAHGIEKDHCRWLVMFFGDHYLRLVTHRIWKWPLLLFFVGLAVVFSISATNLVIDNKQVALFKESHHFSRGARLNSVGFVDNAMDYSIQLSLVWGLRERDMSSCHFSDYSCKGRQVYDDTFNPSTREAQRSLVNLCDTLASLTDQQVEELMIRRDLNTGKLLVTCFTPHLQNYLKNDITLSGLDVDLPWNRSHISSLMASHSSVYNTSSVNSSSYQHFLDVPVNYWLNGGFRQSSTTDLQDFHTLLGEQRTEFSSQVPPLSGVQVGNTTVGNRLKFLAVRVSTTLQYEVLSYSEHLAIVNNWQRFLDAQLSKMPAGLKNGFHTTEKAWHWLYVQKTLVESAVIGIVLGVSVALPILIIATCNVINGVLAALTICCVTVCVIGVIPMAGWKLGVLVSLNMCLVVGLAVDYIVHLAEGYHMAEARDRKGRLKHALERMGISVFSGACTTLGASTFMLFAQVQFFFQFGIFMFCTIGFSLVFSLGLYVTVMGIVGPEGDTGDIRIPLRACMRRLKAQNWTFRLKYPSILTRRVSQKELVESLIEADPVPMRVLETK